MKELTVGGNDAGQRLDRFVGKAVPLLPDTIVCPLNTHSMDFPLDSFTSLLSHS